MIGDVTGTAPGAFGIDLAEGRVVATVEEFVGAVEAVRRWEKDSLR